MAKLISQTYGEALVELAVEENKTDDFIAEITMLLEVLEENKEFGELMNHPKIVKEEKKKVLDTVFKERVSNELYGFLQLIVDKDRYSEIENILNYFLDKIKELKGIGVVYVKTAMPLGQEQKKKIEQKLLDTTKFKEVEMHYEVEKSLIGGMKIRIGDRVVDSSIETKLSQLTKQLMKVQLAQ